MTVGRVLTGNCMDQRALSGLVRVCLEAALPVLQRMHLVTQRVPTLAVVAQVTEPMLDVTIAHRAASALSARLANRGSWTEEAATVGPVVTRFESARGAAPGTPTD